MAALLTARLGTPTRYELPNPWHFYRSFQRDGRAPSLILVMLLHQLPPFTGTPPKTDTVTQLVGQALVELARSVAAHR